MKRLLSVLVIALMQPLAFAADTEVPVNPHETPDNRIASVFVSQDFINEQIAAHSKSEMLKELKIILDPVKSQMFLRGIIQVPIEELRAINLDPKLGVFKFQVSIKPDTTKNGHLILDFPLAETYFYPAASKDPTHERVIIPVQLLSLALASARGYLAALSGDFSGFERRTAKLEALLKSVERSITVEKNADAREELKNQREALRLQVAAIPIERKQLETVSKGLEKVLGFTGEKELKLNDELGARANALILKIKLSQLTPYLHDIDLGGVRILPDKLDGAGENYLAIDLNSPLSVPIQKGAKAKVTRPPMKVAPALIMRLNQALFESEEVLAAEKKDMGSLRKIDFQLTDDGLHVSGSWHSFLFLSFPFDTVVDFVSTQPDTFEVRVRELKVAGINFEFLTSFLLESMKKRLNHAMKGICKFKYVGVESDHSRALQVTVDPKALVPAFPDLHLVAVDVRDREFLLKIGRTQ
jgi:hypothetical protein